MKVFVSKTPELLGRNAAKDVAKRLRKIIAEKGNARIIVSTGASQFDTFEGLIKEDIDWSKVEMFHLDEYVALDESHPASFRKYLKERFISKVNLKKAYLVDDSVDCIPALTKELRKSPVDIGLIGIGENAHIAFNDPPADFDTKEAYRIVELDDACKMQQVGEGWFATINDVPKQAISMTVFQIMECEAIISCVPYAVKNNAVKNTLYTPEVTNTIPSTILKTHKDFSLYADIDSAAGLEKEKFNPLAGNSFTYENL